MNTPKLRALTLHPEWAWAILNLGKDVENRPPSVAKMVLNVVGTGRHGRRNDWLAIHAGAHIGGRSGNYTYNAACIEIANKARDAGWTLRVGWLPTQPWSAKRGAEQVGAEVQTSAIVALCRVGPGSHDSPWAVPGQAQIGLRDLFVLPEPVPCSGKQGLWTVSDEVTAKVYAQVKP